MTVINLMEDARSSLEDFLRKWKFKKANAERASAAELQAALAKCRGQLEICKKDFDRLIREQSRYIAEGMSIGADTLVQERILWDAAIGYMMVKDAIFSLKSINSFDSVSHAYEVLGVVMDNIKERESRMPKMPRFVSKKERNVFGHLTSEEALKKKEELLGGFFESLKRSGDIEACLGAAKAPAAIGSERRTAYLETARPGESTGSANGRWSVLDSDDAPSGSSALGEFNLGDMDDIHPPTD